MDIDNDNDQMSTIPDFQPSRGHNQQALLGLSRYGPHVGYPWPQNDAAYIPIHGTRFPTRSSLSVGFFLPFAHVLLRTRLQ
jgi:hypothetical protein